jgi:hypothetical protein
MYMLHLFAHAGQSHATSAETATHILQEWYIALPLFFISVIGLAVIIFLLSKSKPLTYMSVVALLLVAGVFMYDKSAVVSIVSLTLGMAMAMIIVMVSLLRPTKS